MSVYFMRSPPFSLLAIFAFKSSEKVKVIIFKPNYRDGKTTSESKVQMRKRKFILQRLGKMKRSMRTVAYARTSSSIIFYYNYNLK